MNSFWWYLFAFIAGGCIGMLCMALMVMPSKQPERNLQRTYSAHPLDESVTGTG